MTAAVISFISELLAQWLSGSWKDCSSILTCINWTSLRDQTLIGFFMRGVPIHWWYLFLTWLFRNYDGSRRPVHEKSDHVELLSSTKKRVAGEKEVAQGSVGEMETFKKKEPTWVVIVSERG
jgi:hypothetical protein